MNMKWIKASERLPKQTNGFAKQIVLRFCFEPIGEDDNIQLRVSTINQFLNIAKTGVPALDKIEWLDDAGDELNITKP
jgi:hypothetical protein